MDRLGKHLGWGLLALLGASSLGYIALNRGEQINALWIVVAAVCVYLIAYRYYGLFIAKRVLAVDSSRMTPAVRHNDGLDYVPTDKKVLFGHHFAAIAGAGPLVGPVLAAQMGYLPGMLWLLAGVVLGLAISVFVLYREGFSGKPAGPVRPPLTDCTEAEHAELEALIARLGPQ